MADTPLTLPSPRPRLIASVAEIIPGVTPNLPRPQFFPVNIKLFRQNSDEAKQAERRCRVAGKGVDGLGDGRARRMAPQGLMYYGPTHCHNFYDGTPVWPWDCGGPGRRLAGRAREGKDEMTEISVKTKLWGLIAVMLLLIISVGAVGFVTLDRGASILKELVDQDEALQDLTGLFISTLFNCAGSRKTTF